MVSRFEIVKTTGEPIWTFRGDERSKAVEEYHRFARFHDGVRFLEIIEYVPPKPVRQFNPYTDLKCKRCGKCSECGYCDAR